MTREIALTGGCVALIDDEDYQVVMSGGRWRVQHDDAGLRYAKRHVRRAVGGYTTGWVAAITCDGTRRHLGVFESPELAARAYDAAARELFGEFARLNFPQEESA